MMDEYISREAVLNLIKELHAEAESPEAAEALFETHERIAEHPAADVKPAVKGKWVWQPDKRWWRCDQCGEITTDACMNKPRANYCPWCGADMKIGGKTMSDKLVSLGAVKELFKRIPANMPFGIAECLLNERLNALPPVPQEMSAVEYLETEARMHNLAEDCAECPISHHNNGRDINCRRFEYTYPDEAVAIVEKWAKENPERSEE